MINDATPDIARTPHTFIKRIGSPGQRVGCAIYAEEAVANAMVERLSNALHLKTATAAMSVSQTTLLNRCINQLFINQEKVDTSTKLFSECSSPIKIVPFSLGHIITYSSIARSQTSPNKSGTKLFALLKVHDGNSRNLADGHFESLSTTSSLTVLHVPKILLIFF